MGSGFLDKEIILHLERVWRDTGKWALMLAIGRLWSVETTKLMIIIAFDAAVENMCHEEMLEM